MLHCLQDLSLKAMYYRNSIVSIRAQKVGLVFLRDDCQKVFLFVGGDFAPRETFSWWCHFRLVSSSDELHLWTVGISLCCVTVWSIFLLGEGFLSDQVSMTGKFPLVRLQSSVFTGSQTSVCNTWWGWGFLLWALCDKALHPTGTVALCFWVPTPSSRTKSDRWASTLCLSHSLRPRGQALTVHAWL